MIDIDPPIDPNNLLEYAPDIVVGISFRYYPDGIECEITYKTQSGFDNKEVFLPNTEEEGYTEENSRKKSARALFQVIYKVLGGKE